MLVLNADAAKRLHLAEIVMEDRLSVDLVECLTKAESLATVTLVELSTAAWLVAVSSAVVLLMVEWSAAASLMAASLAVR